MSKHSKHANIRPNYTSAERAASLAEVYGTQQRVLNADNQRPWDVCSLTLSPLGADPVCTPHGHLYDYEAILESLLQQKREYKRALREWKEQQERGAFGGRGFVGFCLLPLCDDAEEKKEADKQRAKEAEEASKFMDGEDKLLSLQPTNKKSRVSETNFDISNMATKRFQGGLVLGRFFCVCLVW